MICPFPIPVDASHVQLHYFARQHDGNTRRNPEIAPDSFSDRYSGGSYAVSPILFCEDFVYCRAYVVFTVDLNDDRLLDVCRMKTHQGDAMNLYRYAMFIARACRGSFVGNVLFANPQMSLFSMLV